MVMDWGGIVFFGGGGGDGDGEMLCVRGGHTVELSQRCVVGVVRVWLCVVLQYQCTCVGLGVLLVLWCSPLFSQHLLPHHISFPVTPLPSPFTLGHT